MKPIDQIAREFNEGEWGGDAMTHEVIIFALRARDQEWRKAVEAINPPDHYRPSCDCYGCKVFRQIRELLKGTEP